MIRRSRISSDLRERLQERADMGSGGFQSLTRKILATIDGDELVVDDELRDQIEHYAFDFGSGGWQLLLREVLAMVDQPDSHP